MFYKYAKLREANKKLNLSLIISTYNRENALEAVLESAMKQSELPSEIIIADDGSGEKTKKVIQQFAKKSSVPIIHCWHENQGFRLATIRNKAMAMAKNEYIVMIDGDIIMHRHFIQSHKKNAKMGQMIQGSSVLLSEKATKKCLTSNKFKFSLFDKGGSNYLNSIYSPLLSKLKSSYYQNIQRVRGANISFWKKDLLRVNGFTEDFTGWGREDSEFIARMHNADVSYKRLKFAGFGCHLHHSKNSRASLRENDAILKETVLKKLVRCESGIDKYIIA